jgi:APA family basic amino acid/polyamine antiporter
MTSLPQEKLVRAIGRWGLTGLMINSIIGGGVFGLPGIIGKLLGAASPWAYVIAAAGMGAIVACFAEISSQFRETGGPYLYARAAFGRFAGIQMGWLQYLVRLATTAANSNLFVIYLGEFWPGAQRPLARALVLSVLIGFHAGINLIGVRGGAIQSSIFAVAKLLPLSIFVVAGVAYMISGGAAARPVFSVPMAAAPLRDWMSAILLLVYAFGGAEAAVAPMGEAKDPQRDAPFAMFVGLGVSAVVYLLVQVVTLAALPAGAGGERPLAAAAAVFLGPAGAALMGIGALISLYGNLGANMINGPRITYGLAEKGDFPPLLARVHPSFRTPHISILIFAGGTYALAFAATFQWNAVLSALARLFGYIMVCGALPVLRRRTAPPRSMRIPGGLLFSAVGMLCGLVLVSRMGKKELIAMLLTAGLAGLNWLWARNRATPAHEPANLP